MNIESTETKLRRALQLVADSTAVLNHLDQEHLAEIGAALALPASSETRSYRVAYSRTKGNQYHELNIDAQSSAVEFFNRTCKDSSVTSAELLCVIQPAPQLHRMNECAK